MKVRQSNLGALPAFDGCQDWMKPIMLNEYEVLLLFTGIDLHGLFPSDSVQNLKYCRLDFRKDGCVIYL
jgi:hypothetical protein